MGNDDVFLEDDNMWLYINFIGNCTSNMFFSFNTDLHGKILCSFHMASIFVFQMKLSVSRMYVDCNVMLLKFE
jgi:hypothetical protein